MSAQRPEPVPSVAAVVLNWNGTEDTLECLPRLALVDYPGHEVIVVDNGADPSPQRKLLERFPSVSYVGTGRNLGHAAGNKVGTQYALSAGHEYVFVLNNDRVVERAVLREAVAVAASGPAIAVVAVEIIGWDDPACAWVAYGQVTYRRGRAGQGHLESAWHARCATPASTGAGKDRTRHRQGRR
jgi:hypothetical protein